MTVSLMPDLRPVTHVAYSALRVTLAEAKAAGDTEAVWQTKGALSVVLKAQKKG